MKFQNIHVHFDDFEFTAAGTFELARRREADDFAAQVVVCTDGAAGHHQLTREETAQTREREQRASAEIGQFDLHCLRYPDGSRPREATMEINTALLAALWKVIREFRPDYLFCPPIPANPLVGVHVDHLVIAEAMRRVVFLVNVPHAFTPEYPGMEGPAEFVDSPVVLNVFDGYMFENDGFDLAVDVSDAFDLIAEESWCHQSQIMEWLPWVHGNPALRPKNFSEWKEVLYRRAMQQNRNAGIKSDRPYEFFTLTGWGGCPTLEKILSDIPGVDPKVSQLDRLESKINRMQNRNG